MISDPREDNIALIDLDATTADFDGSMRKLLDRLRSPEEPPSCDYAHDKAPPHIEARRDLIKRMPGFWRSLPRLELGFHIVDYLRTKDWSLVALTRCPRSKPVVWAEKIEWCMEHLPDAQYTLTETKTNIYGKILVDDFPDYFLPWLQVRPRGLVIAVAHPWNADIRHPHVIRYDGTNFDQVKFAIDQAYLRQRSQPLELSL